MLAMGAAGHTKEAFAAELMRGGAQAAMLAMGNGCKYRGSFTQSLTAHSLLCNLAPNRPQNQEGPKHSCELEPTRPRGPPDRYTCAFSLSRSEHVVLGRPSPVSVTLTSALYPTSFSFSLHPP
ncbi:unnamed protein product [Rangifer tarandus platyrhynchus]|uniref:Uncharacterized protein n=1 Tax=Rangifer tarandus platyrhynchus TaxID=3082113 RepID=A0AC60A917_RANTA